MKVLLIATVFLFMAVCERPPQTSEIQRGEPTPAAFRDRELRSGSGVQDAPVALQQVDTLIELIERTIDTAQLASTRTLHPGLKKLSTEIVRDRQAQLETLRSYRIGKWGDRPSAADFDSGPTVAAREKSDLDKLESLKADEFDSEFIAQMEVLNNAAGTVAGALAGADKEGVLREFTDGFSESISSESTDLARFKAVQP